LEKDPSSPESLSGLMNTFFAQKQFDKAIAAPHAIAKVAKPAIFMTCLARSFNGKRLSERKRSAPSD